MGEVVDSIFITNNGYGHTQQIEIQKALIAYFQFIVNVLIIIIALGVHNTNRVYSIESAALLVVVVVCATVRLNTYNEPLLRKILPYLELTFLLVLVASAVR